MALFSRTSFYFILSVISLACGITGIELLLLMQRRIISVDWIHFTRVHHIIITLSSSFSLFADFSQRYLLMSYCLLWMANCLFGCFFVIFSFHYLIKWRKNLMKTWSPFKISVNTEMEIFNVQCLKIIVSFCTSFFAVATSRESYNVNLFHIPEQI